MVTLDTVVGSLISRECHWNVLGRAERNDSPLAWGATQTIPLSPRLDSR